MLVLANKRFTLIFVILLFLHLIVLFIPIKNHHLAGQKVMKISFTSYKKPKKQIYKPQKNETKKNLAFTAVQEEQKDFIQNDSQDNQTEMITSHENTLEERVYEFNINEINAPHIYNFYPKYPPLLKKLKKEGSVTLKVLVDENGKLIHTEVISSDDERFLKSVMDAIKKAYFTPALINGKNSKAYAILKVSFKLEE